MLKKLIEAVEISKQQEEVTALVTSNKSTPVSLKISVFKIQ